MRKANYGRVSTDYPTLSSQIDGAGVQGIDADDCYVETADGFKTMSEDRGKWQHAMTALRRGGVSYVQLIDVSVGTAATPSEWQVNSWA